MRRADLVRQPQPAGVGVLAQQPFSGGLLADHANLSGQPFDAQGHPLPTVHGKRLGRERELAAGHAQLMLPRTEFDRLIRLVLLGDHEMLAHNRDAQRALGIVDFDHQRPMIRLHVEHHRRQH